MDHDSENNKLMTDFEMKPLDYKKLLMNGKKIKQNDIMQRIPYTG